MVWIVVFMGSALLAEDEKTTIRFNTVSKEEVGIRLRSGEVKQAEREPKLRELFEKSGCAGENLTEQPVKNVKAPNLICTLPGETGSTIAVGGHFDFVDAGRGLADNWSGSSLLPSLYQSLHDIKRRHTYLFIGFTAEEKGLVGSRFLVTNMTPKQVNKTSAMINLDSLGLSSTKVESYPADKTLVALIGLIAMSLHLPVDVVNVHRVGRTDSDSFLTRHIPILNIHSLTAENIRILHSPRDNFRSFRLDDYYDSYLLIRAYLAYLDQFLDRPAATAAGAP
jgi:hypothetical protein